MSYYSKLFSEGPSRDPIGALAQTEIAILASLQDLVATHHGLHDRHGLPSEVEARFHVLIGLSLDVSDNIVSLRVLDFLDKYG